jgi:processive 1,2-diacylglycerol beta-glucosyltransferase
LPYPHFKSNDKWESTQPQILATYPVQVANPRILILTAGFGDGHNSAAKHLAEALDSHVDVCVADPCDLGSPRTNRFLSGAYREITTYTPRVWKWIYDSTDRQDFTKPLPFLKKTEDALGKLLKAFRPDLVVSTYPFYPYPLDRHFETLPRVPIITVVTDSMKVNAAWTRSPSDHFLVTDPHTASSLEQNGVSGEKIIVTGFPVSSRFEALPPVDQSASIDPFRVLFFPTARSPHVKSIMRSVLESPGLPTEITVVLGRNVRRLYRRAQELKQEFPGRVKLKGWTKQVPELLSSHHLVIGKAGGATVHESIAAQCPMLVHHIVPGQEEGNIDLLEKLGIGSLATEANEIKSAIAGLLADDAALWRAQKERLAIHARPAASQDAAEFILSLLPKK